MITELSDHCLEQTDGQTDPADHNRDDRAGELIHDLRNSLALLTAAQRILAQAELFECDQKWAVNVLERQANRLRGIVESLEGNDSIFPAE
jgi:nitrogen-specific signal transduction histidine kinase